jgi:DNA-binding MarR family transcriptional regulator
MKEEFTDALIDIYRAVGFYERDAVCCGDVTVQQCMALQILRDESMDVGTLASRMGVTPGATTRLVDRMLAREWVERHRDPSDRRRVLLELTDAGRDEAASLRGLTEDVVEVVVEQLPTDERESVLRAMKLLRQALEEVDVEGGVCCA